MGLGRMGPIGPALLFALVVAGNTILWAIDDVLYTRIGESALPCALVCARTYGVYVSVPSPGAGGGGAGTAPAFRRHVTRRPCPHHARDQGTT